MGDGETGFYETSDVVEDVDAYGGEDVGQHRGLVHVELGCGILDGFFIWDDDQTYSGHDDDEAKNVGRKEEVVSPLSPVLGGKENDHVETDKGDCAPDGIGEFHRLFERSLQGPLVN